MARPLLTVNMATVGPSGALDSRTSTRVPPAVTEPNKASHTR